jgi:hypothetical protein
MIREDPVHDDQSNSLGSHVGRLDESVERLTSEVASLKLELATISSALRELRSEQSGRRVLPIETPIPIEPPSKPSLTPAAVVVLMATGLLAWQLIATPMRTVFPPVTSTASLSLPSTLPDQPSPLPSTEPPITPLVKPTIYKGTLSVNADRPGATVFVNREHVGQAPVRIRNLRAGAHLVWIERDGYRRWTRVITVPAERVTRVSADLEPVGPQ